MNDKEKKIQSIIENNPKNATVISEVVRSIGNVPKEEVIEYLIEMEKEITTLSIEEITAITIERFKGYRKTDIEVDRALPKVIEENLNSKELETILTGVLSNLETIAEHNLIVLDGTPLGANIYKTRLIIGFISNYIIVHQEAYDMPSVYESLTSRDLNAMTEDELNKFFNQIIAASVEKKLGVSSETIEGKRQITEYVYRNFIENGYCYQGSNSNFRQNIEQNGLTTAYSKTTDQDLIIVDEIFRRHGVDKVFHSKLSETKVAPYYYTTDGMDSAYHFSYHNPEYFAYFVASGNYMPNEKYNRTAYYLRDREGCRNNVERLCEHYGLTESETLTVLQTFDSLADTFITEQPNSVTLVSRKLINKDKIPFDFSTIPSRSVESIIGEITQNREGSKGTKQNIPIPANQIAVISVPPLERFYDKEKVEGLIDKRKYIILEDGTKYYYDILIHADKIDYDCISISDREPNLYTLVSRDSKHKGEGTIDVIACPSDIGPDTLLSNGSISFQSLQMMIAVNGKANSKKGQGLIDTARRNYSPEYMSNFYYHLCEICCNIAKDKSVDTMARCQAILRMAKDFFPKAELMRITGDYPEFVSEDSHLYEYLPYFEHLQVNAVERIKNGIDQEYDSEALDYLADVFTEKLKGKINPDFTEEFMSKAREYGMTKLVESIHPKTEHEESENFPKDNQSEELISAELQPSGDQATSVESAERVSEISAMFEETTHDEHTTNNEKPKVYEKTVPQTGMNSDSTGKTNFISIVIVMIITVFTLIYLLILK